jgi:hypothetical protein
LGFTPDFRRIKIWSMIVGMVKRRVPLHGLMAALLALMAQLGIGASVPRFDPLAQIAAAATLCHAPDGAGGTQAPPPAHPLDCLVCLLCGPVHAPSAVLVAAETVPMSSVPEVAIRPELPPRSTAPPRLYHSSVQPRAPPAYS